MKTFISVGETLTVTAGSTAVSGGDLVDVSMDAESGEQYGVAMTAADAGADFEAHVCSGIFALTAPAATYTLGEKIYADVSTSTDGVIASVTKTPATGDDLIGVVAEAKVLGATGELKVRMDGGSVRETTS